MSRSGSQKIQWHPTQCVLAFLRVGKPGGALIKSSADERGYRPNSLDRDGSNTGDSLRQAANDKGRPEAAFA